MIEIGFPSGAGIHNGTSSLFHQKGIRARVHLPHGPVINLPFENSDFMKIMKWRVNDYPSVGNPIGAIIQIESETPEQARDLIIQGAN